MDQDLRRVMEELNDAFIFILKFYLTIGLIVGLFLLVYHLLGFE